MSKIEIPRKSIYRLSLYHRCLQSLIKNDIETVSSKALSRAAGVKPTQLRKDLAYFGQLGTRGLGYNVQTLTKFIGDALGRTQLQPVILVGAGNLGTALLRYRGFNKEGFEILAAFDADKNMTKKTIGTIEIKDFKRIKTFIAKNEVKMAILTVPGESAQIVANTLTEAGIEAILNFSATVLHVPESVAVSNVDLAMELENLSYFVK